MATLQYERPTFTPQSGNPENVEFQVKPSTPKNREEVFTQYQREIEELASDEGPDPEEQVLNVLKTFAEPLDGDWNSLIPEELDQKEIEYYFNEGFI